MKLTPYVLTTARNLPFLQTDIALPEPIDIFDVGDPYNRDFCQLINLSNQDAFGGAGDMGMPLWVMLDCAILPSAMVGFYVHSDDLNDEQRRRLHALDYEGPVPVSEYSASPSIEPNTVCGFSLQSQMPGLNLGVRTKALALAVFGAKQQIGVTQFTNPAIRVHTKLGNLELTMHKPIVHTHSDNSFVYALNVPDHSALIDIATGQQTQVSAPVPNGDTLYFDPSNKAHHDQVAAALAADHKVTIVQPGFEVVNGSPRLSMVLTES